MDRDSLFVLLSHHKEGVNIDHFTICELYAATLADVAEKVSNDEMRRLLIVGSFLFNRSCQDPPPTPPDDERYIGSIH